jgi:release factor glutamine methyltransferase
VPVLPVINSRVITPTANAKIYFCHSLQDNRSPDSAIDQKRPFLNDSFYIGKANHTKQKSKTDPLLLKIPLTTKQSIPMPNTLHSLLSHMRQQLQILTPTPQQLNAELRIVLQHFLNLSPSQWLSTPEKMIMPNQWASIQHYLDQRIIQRIPVQYIVGYAFFYDLPFKVTPDVLIPRPETEQLVEQALAMAKPGSCLVDVGTGSGAIAIALSKHLQQSASIFATDCSEAALEIARYNQTVLNTNVQFLPAGHLLQPLGNTLNSMTPVDLIISNPPYINPANKGSLLPEVAWHEPELALFTPQHDPLYFYRELGQSALVHLVAGGALLVEIESSMGLAVVACLQQTAGYSQPRLIRDYAGLDRIVVAYKV